MAYNVMWKVASKTANDDEVDKSKATQAIASYVTSAQAIARARRPGSAVDDLGARHAARA